MSMGLTAQQLRLLDFISQSSAERGYAPSYDEMQRHLDLKSKSGINRLHEPACGVGGMILAANAVLRQQGLDPGRDAHWWAVDVDFAAMAGAYIQCSLTGTSATVVWGDTLRLEERDASVTPVALLNWHRFTRQAVSPSAIPPADARGQFEMAF